MGQYDQSLNFIGHKLLNIAALGFLLTVADEYQKLIAKFLICGQYLIQHFGVEVEKQVRDNDPHKFCPSAGQNSGNLVFLIVQISQRLSDDLLILHRQGIGIVKIPGNCGFRKIRVLCDIAKGHALFPLHGLSPPAI